VALPGWDAVGGGESKERTGGKDAGFV